ncbi:MAG: DNA adenine methylase [Polyangiaceae bacterium]
MAKGRAVPRPFLKWAGGKGQLLDQIRPLLPESFARYFEPFVGGAALFFALKPARAALADVNAELVHCYRAIQKDVEAVVRALRRHRYDRDHYYRVRAVEPASLDPARRAARTIFLNKAGFNGLYRVNQSGTFNVPFGRYEDPTLCDAVNLRACALALQGAEIRVRDFEEVTSAARAGDFVYFDPPYVPLSKTAAFTSYSALGFGAGDQERLAKTFRALAQRGVQVMLSNSDTPAVRDLYRGFRIDEVLAARSINSRGAGRGKVGEVIVRSFAPKAPVRS